jgi:hypothetical protein
LSDAAGISGNRPALLGTSAHVVKNRADRTRSATGAPESTVTHPTLYPCAAIPAPIPRVQMSKKAKAGAGPEIFVSGYLLHAKGGDLSKRLESAAAVLATLKQEDERPAGLENIAAALVEDAILKSKNKVRREKGPADAAGSSFLPSAHCISSRCWGPR